MMTRAHLSIATALAAASLLLAAPATQAQVSGTGVESAEETKIRLQQEIAEQDRLEEETDAAMEAAVEAEEDEIDAELEAAAEDAAAATEAVQGN